MGPKFEGKAFLRQLRLFLSHEVLGKILKIVLIKIYTIGVFQCFDAVIVSLKEKLSKVKHIACKHVL